MFYSFIIYFSLLAFVSKVSFVFPHFASLTLWKEKSAGIPEEIMNECRGKKRNHNRKRVYVLVLAGSETTQTIYSTQELFKSPGQKYKSLLFWIASFVLKVCHSSHNRYFSKTEFPVKLEEETGLKK